ncbi:hypothetical protein OGAPHI_000891 [Ogataea philodendri]|uniref:Zn(2)-C6 fungal-type domain-containing protein n=1 Tax=Ogataea philodendri TaxID=1378263 RepID=A0A9P8PEH4_9ASCO|nr:uncharacterized protein OGAPHI_000891 [Ogataea philodendri]KAH3670376.1 hypothetical protein OGAPHI_000891 [Ogataea philodendri]
MSTPAPRVCSSCKALRRKDCDGRSPSCSNCIKRHRECVYLTESDKRRRKYHTDYIQYLEEKIETLEKFVRKHDPDLIQYTDMNLEETPFMKRLDEEAQLATLLNEIDNLDLDNFSEPEEDYEDFGSLIAVTGPHIYYIDPIFKAELANLFQNNCPEVAYILKLSLPDVISWDFSTDSNPSHQLLMCAMFGFACVYSKNPHSQKISKLFINQAEQTAVYASKFHLDQYVVQGLLLLSCYEMGLGNDSMSYLHISMACALTQHMGYHISYDEDSSAAKFAPKTTPYQSALLWSICTQDRIITTKIGVPSCIHFKRIISPFYEVQSPPSSQDYLIDLCFCYITRLWYILDRFTDQICSVQGDLGDTQERTKLLKTAEQALQDLKTSLPAPFKDPNYSQEFYIIIFHLHFEGCSILLERLFIENPVSSSKCVGSATEISRLVNVLLKTNNVEKTSYHFGYICFLAAMIHLVLYAEKAKPDHLSNFEICVQAMLIHGNRWKRSFRHINMLREFSDRHGISVPILETCENDQFTAL